MYVLRDADYISCETFSGMKPSPKFVFLMMIAV